MKRLIVFQSKKKITLGFLRSLDLHRLGEYFKQTRYLESRFLTSVYIIYLFLLDFLYLNFFKRIETTPKP